MGFQNSIRISFSTLLKINKSICSFIELLFGVVKPKMMLAHQGNWKIFAVKLKKHAHIWFVFISAQNLVNDYPENSL